MKRKKKQSHSFLTENKRSTTEHIAAKSDPKSHVSKNSLLTHANVKEMVAQIGICSVEWLMCKY